MKKISALLLAVASACFFTGCVSSYSDTTLYQVDGRAKPIVAFLPVRDCTQEDETHGITWDISRELTESLRSYLSDSSKIYLLKDRGTVAMTEHLMEMEPEKISRALLPGLDAAEFVVLTELINRREEPLRIRRLHPRYPADKDASAVLALDFRVVVLDLRGDRPRVVLQEIVEHQEMLARPETNYNYDRVRWGSEAYRHTPLGLAHNKLVREVAARLENYIYASKG